MPGEQARHGGPDARHASWPGRARTRRCSSTRSARASRIVNNGTRKGGEPFAMRSMFSSPGLEDVWEMHFSLLSGQEYTVPGTFIANQIDQPEAMRCRSAPGRRRCRASRRRPRPPTMARSNYFKVTAQQDGTFTVTNTRNNFSKTYRPGGVNATK